MRNTFTSVPKPLIFTLLASLAVTQLTACGQRGELYLPKQSQPTAEPAQPVKPTGNADESSQQ